MTAPTLTPLQADEPAAVEVEVVEELQVPIVPAIVIEQRIRRALVALGHQVSPIRTALDTMLRFVTVRSAFIDPGFRFQPHPTYRETSHKASRNEVLYFYAGRAVHAYYDLVRAHHRHASLIPASLLAPVTKLYDLSTLSLTSFCTTGSPALGYQLELVSIVKDRNREATR